MDKTQDIPSVGRMAIQSYRPASEGEKPLYIGGKTSETYRAVTYEDRKAGHKTHDLCWFYLQRHVSVEISKKNRRDCTKSRAQCPNIHLRSDAIRSNCGEALEQDRNATRHGRNLSVGVRAGSLAGWACSLCRSPGKPSGRYEATTHGKQETHCLSAWYVSN